MNKPLVSIIIPAYNADNLILEALVSVKAQTYPAWEVIVVEDASKDKTKEIVQQFAQTVGDRQVKYIRHQQNQGQAAARNTGIESAQGKYLAFLDHDDIWQETHLEAAVEQLESENVDLVYSTVEMFQDGTNKKLGFWGPDQEDLDNFPASLFLRNYIQPSAVVMKKNIVEKGFIFDTDSAIRGVEDLDYWLRIAANNYNFACVSGIHVLYRKSRSAMTANTKKMDEAVAIVLRKNYHLNIIPPKIKRYKLARKHIKVALWNWRKKPLKASEYMIWALKITPQGCLESIIIFIKEKINKVSFDEKKLYL